MRHGDTYADVVGRMKEASDAITHALRSVDWADLEFCDCGCRRFEHLHGVPELEGRQPCVNRERCGCMDFDDLNVRADAWVRRERERVRRERESAQHGDGRLRVVYDREDAA